MKKIGLFLLSGLNVLSNVNITVDGNSVANGNVIAAGSKYAVNNNASIVISSPSSYIDVSNNAHSKTTFELSAGATLTVVNAAGTTIFTGTGPGIVQLQNPLTGAETDLYNVATFYKVPNVTVTPNGVSTTSITSVTPGITTINTQTSTSTTVTTPTGTAGTTTTQNTASTQNVPISKIYIPRSKLDLDLTEEMTSSGFKTLEDSRDNSNNGDDPDLLNIQFVNDVGKYKDNTEYVRYKTNSSGVTLTGSKKIDNFTVGGGVGYQKSSMKYKENFDGVKEKMESYQLMLNGGYDFNEKTDLSGVLTYSHNKHKFETNSGIGIAGAKYKSEILDFQTRVGHKFGDSKKYVKPFIGLGVTNVRESEIKQLGVEKTSGTHANATVGVIGKASLNESVDVFGSVDYKYRFGDKTYHKERKIRNSDSNVEGLDYNNGVNIEVGAKYKFSKFNVTASYKLKESEDNVFKVGFEMEW